MREKWGAFAASLYEIVVAAGYWTDEGQGVMGCGLELRFYDTEPWPAEATLSLTQDVRLRSILSRHALVEAQTLFAACPEWFLPLCLIRLKLTINEPSAQQLADAAAARPLLAQDARLGLPRDLVRRPAGWRSLDGPRRPKQTLYVGWDDFTDDHFSMDGLTEILYSVDPWRPSWIVWYAAEWRDECTGKRVQELSAWCEENCRGRYRHMFSGVYEFELHEDADGFDRRWSSESGDWEAPVYDIHLSEGTEILKCGGAGFSVTLMGCREEDEWKSFWTVTNEVFLYDLAGSATEGMPPPIQESAHVTSWEEALSLLNGCDWPTYYPQSIHPQFRLAIWEAYQATAARLGPEAVEHRASHWRRLCQPEQRTDVGDG